jgi:hypothetical protein
LPAIAVLRFFGLEELSQHIADPTCQTGTSTPSSHKLMRKTARSRGRSKISRHSRTSICVSVAYVAWLFGHDPTRCVIVVNYSNEFAAALHR